MKIRPLIFAMLLPAASLAATAVDSTNTAIRPGSQTSKMAYTFTPKPCFNTMQDVINFTGNSGNLCSSTNTRIFCYKQLSAAKGDTSTREILQCPIGYQPIMSFGEEIQNVGNPNDKLIYTARDVRNSVSKSQEDYYWTQNYTCRDYGNVNYFEDAPPNANPATMGRRDWREQRYWEGNWYTQNGTNYRVNRVTMMNDNTSNWSTHNPRCGYWNGTSHAANVDSICANGTASAYWLANYSVRGSERQCERPAGFYTQQEGAPYPLPAASSTVSPTIVVCGKSNVSWRAYNANPNDDACYTTDKTTFRP